MRLDETWVIVRLHLENRGIAVANVHDARVLAWALDDAGPLRRKPPEVYAGGFVGAVLAPHDAEDPELGVGRRAPKRLGDPDVLLTVELVLSRKRGADGGISGKGRGYRRGRRSHVQGGVSGNSSRNPLGAGRPC